ncbi:outer membrane homotrimeric porin [Desulfovibrio mangrovi]|uniref:outer membrane homotrimeric porin n=1 Tax=Desulfovibrio mangrovi TaxID=2976983 RepID=UPI0022477CAC|nr:outer membrane homotrimeric porin [Desulfovibrio mangrovi]UZP65880.1 outer membrane homotrimeric porin [Desulfovibrio mangrovi]
MKRVITLMLALALVFGAVANSSATDFKAKGTYQIGYQWTDNTNFNDADSDGASEDDFVAKQRFRTQIDIVSSENLSGVVFFEINNTWGRTSGGAGNGAGGAIGADGVNVQTRRAFIDWTVPNTALDIRMGIQGLALPGVVAGSPVLDNDVAAVVATYKFNDMFSMNAVWARPFDTSAGEDTTVNAQDEMDVFALIGGVKMDGMEFTPWAAYAAVGKDIADIGNELPGLLSVAGAQGVETYEDNARAYWLGLGFSMDMFDPIVFKMDAMYGSVDSGDAKNSSNDDALDRSGWTMIGKLSYKMDMVTPGVIGWYSSGEDDDVTNGSERLPRVDGSFTATSFGFDGAAAGFASQDNIGLTNEGTWAAGLLLEDIKVIDSLTSQFRVVYVKGTNDADFLDSYVNDYAGAKSDLLGTMLTDEDSAWEINFDHKYDIYENLALFVEMGYINLDLDEDAWGITDNSYDDDAYKLGFVFQYTF